mmetsp:Transcript_2188/g.6192  ORF Transcript_2188/g.6192 Transcript_2188/m.6192 type:complete len:180 (-) Transcript_2188:87-626(-)|eukprot:CAMPEP_0194478554 /NCGR_PEP_ID=MMETSP0253-20130528/1958_1 /TAXON_ID=2966 /ORGANISM="Noctiluca scintillans" /LENGTH=179 /DNA_ID=CAMNT_0039317655 /DNA_START=38 /DNA_END=577 /DNA_ORIENTATION=+
MERVAQFVIASLLVWFVGGESSNVVGDALPISVNASLAAENSVEYELHLDEAPKKSKVVLAVLCLCGLNLFGADRCYLGGCGCGFAKGLTLGGLGVWALVDWIVILVNQFNQDPSIEVASFHAEFDAATVLGGLVITVFTVVTHFTTTLVNFYQAQNAIRAKKALNAREPEGNYLILVS